MNVDDLKKFFGYEKDIQLAGNDLIGVNRSTISKWRKGGIPLSSQTRLEVVTGGGVKANRQELYSPKSKSLA